MTIKLCANCNGSMDRHSKICRKCYLKSIEKNPEEWRMRHNENCRRWRADNHERSNEIARKSRALWIEANPDLAKEVQRFNRERVRKQVLGIFGGCCARCGFSDWRALQVDHREGGGAREYKARGGRPESVWKLRTWMLQNAQQADKKYQVLCANCNWIKRHERKEFGGKIQKG